MSEVTPSRARETRYQLSRAWVAASAAWSSSAVGWTGPKASGVQARALRSWAQWWLVTTAAAAAWRRRSAAVNDAVAELGDVFLAVGEVASGDDRDRDGAGQVAVVRGDGCALVGGADGGVEDPQLLAGAGEGLAGLGGAGFLDGRP
jgi:hypothetical protein